jgi:hypothetical protein
MKAYSEAEVKLPAGSLKPCRRFMPERRVPRAHWTGTGTETGGIAEPSEISQSLLTCIVGLPVSQRVLSVQSRIDFRRYIRELHSRSRRSVIAARFCSYPYKRYGLILFLCYPFLSSIFIFNIVPRCTLSERVVILNPICVPLWIFNFVLWSFDNLLNCYKGEVIPVLNYLSVTTWRRMVEWRYSYTILDYGTRCSDQIHAPPPFFLPPWNSSRYLLSRKMVGLNASLETVRNRNISLPCSASNHDCSARSPLL